MESRLRADPAGAARPRSVDLAVRAAWGLVGLMGLVVVLMAVFHDDVVGAWADHHEGAREVFDQGGRVALERAGFAPPNFLPVAATMLVVGAMIVWVLGVFLRLGYRWGQLGLSALMVGCVYASIALGFVLVAAARLRRGGRGLVARRGGDPGVPVAPRHPRPRPRTLVRRAPRLGG